MLKLLRQGGAGQWLMGGIVIAIIIVFVVPAVSGGPGGSLAEQCAVKVRGKCVSVKDYYAAYGLISANNQLSSKRAKSLGLPEAALDGLVERELLLLDAKRLGIGVAEDSLDTELMAGRVRVSVPVEQHGYLASQIGIGAEMVRYLPVTNSKSGEFDYSVYERVVRNVSGRSAAEFREQQVEELTANRVRDLVKSRVRVSQAEAWAQYQREKTRASARVVSVSKVWVSRYLVDASDKALDAWLKDNQAKADAKWEETKADFKAGCPVVREILITTPFGASDEEKAEKRALAEQVLAELKKPGAKFAELAREHSEGVSAPLGGMLGCLSEKYGPGHELLTTAVAELAPGKYSGIVELPAGFAIAELVSKPSEAEVEALGRREMARAVMLMDVAETTTRKLAEELLDAVKGGEALEAAAERISLAHAGQGKKLKAGETLRALEDENRPKQTITPEFALGSRPIRDALEDVASHAFALEKADSVHPNLISTATGFAILQLREKVEAKREEFDKERFEFSERLLQAKQQEALRNYIQGLRKSSEGLIIKNEALLKADKAPEEES